MRGRRPASDADSRDGAQRPSASGDGVLLQRVADGDLAAFDELHRLYHPRLVRYVFRVARRAELVDEVVNDVLLAVWRSAGDFRGRSKVSTWIFGIAYRQTMKALGRRSRRPESRDPVELDGNRGREDSGQRRRELRATLETALAELSPEQRAVVELTYYQGHTYPEISEIVGRPVGTIKTRMFHARRKLRSLLQDDLPEAREEPAS